MYLACVQIQQRPNICGWDKYNVSGFYTQIGITY